MLQLVGRDRRVLEKVQIRGQEHFERNSASSGQEESRQWRAPLILILAPGEQSHSYITSGTIILSIRTMHCYNG
jgi:hypothetical protein